MEFAEFSLEKNLLEGIADAGYVTCTPVQEQVLQNSLDGSDLYVQSQTGTGKTAAYLVSIIEEMLSVPEKIGKKALIMVPTRELAVQVEEEAGTLISHTNLTAASFYGGVGYDKQIALLGKGVDIIIGTPGRVIDLQEGRQMDLSSLAFLVIDEADRMFDMGFYPDLRKLLKVLPDTKKRQTMLFSATLNSYVKNLAWEYTDEAKEITIEAENITVEEIDQELLHVSSDEKVKLLLGILRDEKPASVLIFCNTKRGCEVLGKRLRINGYDSEFIIGDLPQAKRLQVLERFKEGKVSILVATDVAARGIDVESLSMVVNYDLPNEAENYVHRIGRTARAGKSGKAYTFCSEQDVYNLPPIERYIEMQIPAKVASPSQMAEDKSEGIYIRTDNYREDYGDSHGGSRRHSSETRRRTTNRSAKDSGFSGRNSVSHRKPQTAPHKENVEDLSNLTFEERMKIYKKRYGSTGKKTPDRYRIEKSSQNRSNKNTTRSSVNEKNTIGGGIKNRNTAGKNRNSVGNSTYRKQPSVNRNHKISDSTVKQKSVQKPLVQKKGILSLLKSLFGKKN